MLLLQKSSIMKLNFRSTEDMVYGYFTAITELYCDLYIYKSLYTLYTYIYTQVHLNKLECREKVHFSL